MTIETLSAKQADAKQLANDNEVWASELEEMLNNEVPADYREEADQLKAEIFNIEFDPIKDSWGAAVLQDIFIPAQNPGGFRDAVVDVGYSRASLTRLDEFRVSTEKFRLRKKGESDNDVSPDEEKTAKQVAALVLRECLKYDTANWADKFPKIAESKGEAFSAHVKDAAEEIAGFLPGKRTTKVRRTAAAKYSQYPLMRKMAAAAAAAAKA